jgi:glycosyltransferase involved in cell wall biosynthesis
MSDLAVSVVMPVYNAERYVAEAVESILSQTFSGFEFLITDDGSNDGSLAILERYARQDQRIRLISRPNTGYVRALNEMLDMSRGEFIARMDADDISLPDRFRSQVDFLMHHSECIAVGGQRLAIDSDGDPLFEILNPLTHDEIDLSNINGFGSSICHPSVMMRRKIVIDIGKYKEKFYAAEDLDLFLRLAEHSRLANLPQVVIKYRLHPSSVGNSQPARQAETVRQVVREARLRRGLTDNLEIPLSRPMMGLSQISPVDLALAWGWAALMAGHVATSRKYARARLRRAPFSFATWKLLSCAIRGH